MFEELDNITEEAWKAINLKDRNNLEGGMPLPFVIKLFEYFEENATFMNVILGPNGDPSFQVRLKEVIKKKMLDKFFLITEEEKRMVPLDYLTAYISSAHLGVIQHWLKVGMDKSPHEMATMLSQTTFWGPAKAAGLTFD